MEGALNLFKKINKKTILIILAIIFLAATIYFAWYWYKIVLEIKWGKNVSLGNTIVLKVGERAYYKKDQIQIQFIEITDSNSNCKPDNTQICTQDWGAQFSATNYKNNNSSKFYLSPTMVPQMPLFDLQIQLIDINKDSGAVRLKIFNQN